MRILVTGGAGFIGSNLVDFLIAHNHEITVIDDLSTGHASFVNEYAQLHLLDIQSTNAAAVIHRSNFDAVVHLAAQIDVRKSLAAPSDDAQTNILGTLNILYAARDAGVPTFINISSGGALYGQAQSLPTPESATISPLSPYGASKACTEIYLDLLGRTTSMRCVSLRLSNVYGPRQSLYGEAGVVAVFAKAMRCNRALTIFGDGLQTRDFLYVGDVCSAVHASLKNTTSQGAYNVGTGVQTTIRELVYRLSTSSGANTRVDSAPALVGEVRLSALDWSKAARELLWKPRIAFDEGLALTLDFLEVTQKDKAALPHHSVAGVQHERA